MEVRRSESGGLEFGDMVSFSLKFMFKRWDTLYFFIPVFVFQILSIIYMTNSSLHTEFTVLPSVLNMFRLIGSLLVISLISSILRLYAQMCIYGAAYRQFSKKEWSAWDLMREYIGRLPGCLFVSLLVGLIAVIPAIVVGILSAVVGSLAILLFLIALPVILYSAIRLSVSTVAYVIERKSIIGAINRSLVLTRGRFWYVFGCLLAFGILLGIITGILGLVISLIPGGPSYTSLTVLPRLLISSYSSIAGGSFSFLIFASLVFMRGKPETEKPPEPNLSIIS